MLLTVDDGGDYGSQGNLPYGTLKFNVIENGNRWLGLPTQSIDEEGLIQIEHCVCNHTWHTTADGQPSSSSSLSFDIVSETNPELSPHR